MSTKKFGQKRIKVIGNVTRYRAAAVEASIKSFKTENCGSQEMDPRVQTALRAITEQYAQKLTLESVAKTLGISARHLGRLFQCQVGVSFHQYLKEWRMARAAKLLPGRSVKAVAAEFGYTDASHFSRDFHAVHGSAPASYERGSRPRKAQK